MDLHLPFGDRSSLPASPVFDERPTYRSARTLSKVVAAVFVVDVAALVVTAVLLWDSLGVAQALAAGEEVSEESFNLLDRRAAELTMISIALVVACAVTFGAWTYRVAKNAQALGGQLSITPGWAVGYYFIPIVSMWRPYTALAEVWDASHPDPRNDPSASASHALLLTWWIAWLASSVLDMVVYRSEAPTDAQSWAHQIQMALGAAAVEAIAVGLALAVVWKLTRRQEERAAAMMPTARIA